jgi:prepilin-type N-terminal cleavage/methylation domain-containing protein
MQGSQNTESAPSTLGSGPSPLGRRLGSATPGQSPGLKRRRAFTLTELLVVIAIIGVLASLTVTGVIAALNAAKRGRVLLEIKGLAAATENFKNDYGAFPPNGMHNGNAAVVQRVSADYQKMGKKLSSRTNTQELEVLKALAGGAYSSSVVTTLELKGQGMTAAEAVHFWLGGFSDDPQFPLSGPGGPSYSLADVEILEDRKIRYEFTLSRLLPRTEEGVFDESAGSYVEYQVDMNGNGNTNDAGEKRRINLWYYAPDGFEQPYVYFDCSRYKPYVYDMPASPNTPIYAFKQRRQGMSPSAPLQAKDIALANGPRYQILHPGLDDAWGDFTYMSMQTPLNDLQLFPEGPFTGELADTLTNFADGEIADESEE